MDAMDKLTVEDCEKIIEWHHNGGAISLNMDVYKQLADTMSENQRLRGENSLLQDSLTHFKVAYEQQDKDSGNVG